jgi:bifunctional DNA-binding transcriptional regulator/antitoxin component of YhaV-PrlF toxin-antitoxin module
MSESIVRVQKNKNITLPVWMLKHFRVNVGDYVRLEETKKGVLMKPAKLIDSEQAYFWSKEWQKGEKATERDIQKGRVKKFKGVKGLMKDLRG